MTVITAFCCGVLVMTLAFALAGRGGDQAERNARIRAASQRSRAR